MKTGTWKQILEEARKPCRQVKGSPDSLRFVLQKPISDDDSKCGSKGKKRRKWWRNPFLFLKWRRADCSGCGVPAAPPTGGPSSSSPHAPPRRAFSGPVYLTESDGGVSWTPCRRSAAGGWGKPGSGPLRFSETGDLEIPYLCLRDAAAAMDPPPSAISPSPALPIYLVT